jgi:hypothetical protein
VEKFEKVASSLLAFIVMFCIYSWQQIVLYHADDSSLHFYPFLNLQKKARELKRRQQKDDRAFVNVFQTRALRERKPVSYNYCKELLCSQP